MAAEPMLPGEFVLREIIWGHWLAGLGGTCSFPSHHRYNSLLSIPKRSFDTGLAWHQTLFIIQHHKQDVCSGYIGQRFGPDSSPEPAACTHFLSSMMDGIRPSQSVLPPASSVLGPAQGPVLRLGV